MKSQQGAGRFAPGSIAWTLSRRLGMVLVLVLAFFLSATVTIYTLFRSGDTLVPNVIGRTETEAQKLSEQAGLRVKIQRRVDTTVPANSVIETRPGPNSSVKKDSVLTIVVSTGPTQLKSPAAGSWPRYPGSRRHRVRTLAVNTAKGVIESLRELTQ